MQLPPGNRPGAVMLEVLRGGFVSDPKPLLVLDSAAAVADIERLDVAKHEGALFVGARDLRLLGPGIRVRCCGPAGDTVAGGILARLTLRSSKHMHRILHFLGATGK